MEEDFPELVPRARALETRTLEVSESRDLGKGHKTAP